MPRNRQTQPSSRSLALATRYGTIQSRLATERSAQLSAESSPGRATAARTCHPPRPITGRLEPGSAGCQALRAGVDSTAGPVPVRFTPSARRSVTHRVRINRRPGSSQKIITFCAARTNEPSTISRRVYRDLRAAPPSGDILTWAWRGNGRPNGTGDSED